jgi:methionyl-tRNA formyltransferase
MDKGVDTGDILLQKSMDIEPKETGAGLFDKLAVVGSEAIVEALDLIKEGKIHPMAQDETKATHVGMLKKEMGHIDWSKDAEVIERYVRGLNSWPGTYSYLDGKLLKIWDADVYYGEEFRHIFRFGKVAPGEVLKADKTGIYVATGKNVLVIKSIQPEGKKRMDSAAFLLGHSIKNGEIFG